MLAEYRMSICAASDSVVASVTSFFRASIYNSTAFCGDVRSNRAAFDCGMVLFMDDSFFL